MVTKERRSGHVRALVESGKDDALVTMANMIIAGEDPTDSMRSYARERRSPAFIIDESFPPIPIGSGGSPEPAADPRTVLEPDRSSKFLLSGTVEVGRDGVPSTVNGGDRVYADPVVGSLLEPCLPTCGTSRPVGRTADVRRNLGVETLRDNGLDGSGVAIAIVDSGIFLPRLERPLGRALRPAPAYVDLDIANSWQPPGLLRPPGRNRVGHGTMCAYDALIAAPNATLLDIPMLTSRELGDHHSAGTVATAIQAYRHLLITWLLRPHAFDALVVSNSWGLFHPSLEDFQPTHPGRFIDNPNHVFRKFVRWLSASRVDVVFCGNNCGDASNCAGACASGTCLGAYAGMIMGANAYQEVLTVGGCDNRDRIVGYSSRGPSIAGMFQEKPDLVAYTHFLGSRAHRLNGPDTGVSAACPVAAGCVAALRTSPRVKPSAVPPAALFETLRTTARRPGGGAPGWRPDYGHGIIDPVAAARALQAI